VAQTAIASQDQGTVSPISARGATTTVPAVSPDGSAGGAGSARGAASANDNGAYVDALRRAISTKWEALHPGQTVPNCALSIAQEPGGQVNHATATCPDAADLARALEAAVLMAQPLPYQGYEAAFAPQLELKL
jgi:colicin import membrane protein